MNKSKFGKMSLIGLSLLTVGLCVSGCDYKPRETFAIATVDGKQIRLTCPVVDSGRSMFTYLIDGQCVVEPQK